MDFRDPTLLGGVWFTGHEFVDQGQQIGELHAGITLIDDALLQEHALETSSPMSDGLFSTA